MDRKLLVIGARPGSLGAAIAASARNAKGLNHDQKDWPGGVVTAGISGHEDHELDVTSTDPCIQLATMPEYTDVICTVGVNDPDAGVSWHLEVNTVGVLDVAQCWLLGWENRLELEGLAMPRPLNFVAISSNSAHVPRSPSLGYCVSKAALSMGIRVLGRKAAKEHEGDVRIWGYEPGFLASTPMSKDADLEDWGAPHRIPAGGPGMDHFLLSHRIVDDVRWYSELMQATMHRIDQGDM